MAWYRPYLRPAIALPDVPTLSCMVWSTGKVFFVLGALAYLQVPPLGGSRDEKWHAQWIRKRSVSWNLPKLSQLWQCNGGFGPCTAQNHLRTKQFVSGTWNSSRVAACALRNEEAGRGHRPRLMNNPVYIFIYLFIFIHYVFELSQN